MKKKDILLGAGLTTILVGTGAVNATAHAEEVDSGKPKPTVKTTPVHVTEQDVKNAKADVDKAQADVDAKQGTVDQAKADKVKADGKIDSINKDIDTANNANKISNAQNDIIANKTADKTNATNDLNTAKDAERDAHTALDNANTAKTEADNARDAKKADVDMKQADLDSITDANVRKNITNTTTKISNVDNDLNAKGAQITATDTKIAAKQGEIDSYKVKVISTDLNPDERNHTAHDNLNDYEYNHGFFRNNQMEPVNFQGVDIKEIDATKDMVDFADALAAYKKEPFDRVTKKFKARPAYRYKVDNKGISDAFVKLLNQLRVNNNLKGDMVVDDEYLAYAQKRADEMQKTGVLSHRTSLTNKPGYIERVQPDKNVENILGGAYGQIIDRDGEYLMFDHIVTNETLAYDILLTYYSDYANVRGLNYGHRKNLLTPTGSKMGVAISTIDGKDKTTYFGSFNASAHKGSTYEWNEDDQMFYSLNQSQDEKDYWNHRDNFKQDDPMNPTLYGKKMKFIADTHYVFVKRQIIDGRPKMQAELDALKAQKATQERERDVLVAKKADLTQELDALNNQLNDIATARTNATTALNQAKSDLATLTATAQDKANAVIQKQKELDKATARVNDVTARINTIQSEIDAATSKRDDAMRVHAQLPQLRASLVQAESDRANVEQRITVAEQDLADAKARLTQAQADHKYKSDIFSIDKMLNVYTDGNRVISATPKVAPAVDKLPELDITADIPSDLNTKQNPDGIGATPKVAPKVDELPELDITADIPSDLNTKQNPDGIGATPKDAPVVDELPEFPLDQLPKVEEPKVEQPRVEQPKTEEPKVEQPKVEKPKAEKPKGEEPAQEPKSDRPIDEPNADKPGQAGDQNVKPVGLAPSYQAPAVLSPAQEEAGQKALPNTGSQVNLLTLLGYAFLAGLGIVLKKKEG
jgi:surface protein, putative